MEDVVLAAVRDLPGFSLLIGAIIAVTGLIGFCAAIVRMVDAVETLNSNRRKRRERR